MPRAAIGVLRADGVGMKPCPEQAVADATLNVSVVTVSYRTGPVLRECIRSVLANPEVAELIIVDNGNAAAETRLLDDLAVREARIRLVRPGRNLGFSAACNLGAAYAGSPFIAFANPDLTLAPDTFGRVLAEFVRHPDAKLCGCRIVDRTGQEQRGSRRDVCTPWRCLAEVFRLDRVFPSHPYFRRLTLVDGMEATGTISVPTVSGAFMLMRMSQFLEIGGWDGRMFLHVEDIDLCLRVMKSGGIILFCGDVDVAHAGATSDVSRIFIDLHKTKSLVYYFFKHFSDVYPRWFLSVVAVMLWLRLGLRILLLLPRDLKGIISRTNFSPR